MQQNKSKIFLTIITISLVAAPILYIAININGDLRYDGNFDEKTISGSPNYNNTLYMTPIFEYFTYDISNDNWELENMKSEIGPSGDYYKVGFSVSCWYSANIMNNSGNWNFNPAVLYYKLNRSVDTSMPVLFHMNGGNWGAYGMNNELTRSLWYNDSNCQYDQFGVVPFANLEDPPLRNRLFSLQKDTEFNQYRQKFLTQATEIIYDFSQNYPDLFVGCSLDSEIHLDSSKENGTQLYYDYNPLVINEYQDWLDEKYSISEYNEKFSQSNANFDSVDAPRDTGNKSLWKEWTLFRHHLVQQCVELQAKWLYDTGIPKNQIYSHQILAEVGDERAENQRCDTLETAVTEYGVVGVTRYDLISPTRHRQIAEVAGADWGIFEWNIWHEHTESDYYLYTMQLKSMYQAGVHVVCPNGWFEFNNPKLMIKNNTYFINALKDFATLVKDQPRTTLSEARLDFFDYSILEIYTISEYVDRNFWIVAIPLGISLIFAITIEIRRKRKT